MWEPEVERNDTLDLLDVLRRESNLERLKILVQVLDLAPADDREDVGRPLEDIGNRN